MFEIEQFLLLAYYLEQLQKNWNYSNYFVFLITPN